MHGLSDGPCTIWHHEHTNEELNTVKRCSGCGLGEMLIRDPRALPDESVFSYCIFCGTTFRVLTDSAH